MHDELCFQPVKVDRILDRLLITVVYFSNLILGAHQYYFGRTILLLAEVNQWLPDSRPKLVAGSPEGHTGHVDGKPREARLNHPKGLTVDDRGNIYIADTMNMAIRKISDTGKICESFIHSLWLIVDFVFYNYFVNIMAKKYKFHQWSF